MCNVFRCDPSNYHQFKSIDDIGMFIEQLPNGANFSKQEIVIDRISYCKDTIFIELDLIIRSIRKNWHRIQNLVLDVDFVLTYEEVVEYRGSINEYFQLVLYCLKTNETIERKYVKEILNRCEKELLPLIKHIKDLDDKIVLKLATVDNYEKTPLYQYLHTFFDLNYYILTLYQIDLSRNNEEYLKILIDDLIRLSWKNYRQQQTSFLCSCHKLLWSTIQFYCTKTSIDHYFWNNFNTVTANYENKPFLLRLLNDIATIYSIINQTDTNYQLLEIIIKDIVINCDVDSILSNLKILQPLIGELWLKYGRIDIYQQLWEYFSKHLNHSKRPNLNVNTNELIDITDKILFNDDIDGDFEYFLGMLMRHLSEYPTHWQKIKGRIYSQLSPIKINLLNQAGIYRILLLFVCLTRINFDEAVKRFINFIECLSDERRDCLIHNFYAVFIIRHIRENRDIETITNSYMKQLDNHDSYEILANFLNNFQTIINASCNLQMKQYLLINNWIDRYTIKSHHQEINELFKLFLTILERINQQQIWCHNWENCYKSYIYPTLKQQSSLEESPDICGTLAGRIVLTIPSLLNDAFNYFNNDTITPSITSNFLCTIMENYPNNFIITDAQELIVLKSWIKICLFAKDNQENLTRTILKLEYLPEFIRNEMTNQTKDPFVEFVGILHNNLNQCLQSLTISKLIENCFNSLDNWINQYFNRSTMNEAIILRIYTCVSLVFYKIGRLLYNKHKANCCFTRLITVLLLSNDLIIGKSLHPFKLNAIRKTWHLFFISTVNLNSAGDVYLERVLKELIVKFIPHFTIIDTPILKCLDNDEISGILLEKLSCNFFKYPVREAETNVFKSLRILNEYIDNTTSINSLKIIVDKTLFGLFEIIMFHNQRNAALNVVQSVIKSPLYCDVKDNFSSVLIHLTEIHLAFHTNKYFQLLNVLLKFIPDDLKELLATIKNCIRNVEKMRGVGYDRVLREHYDGFECKLLQQVP